MRYFIVRGNKIFANLPVWKECLTTLFLEYEKQICHTQLHNKFFAEEEFGI